MASGLETETELTTRSWRDGGWLVSGPIEGRLGMLVTELSPAGSRSRLPIPAEDPDGERAGLALAINVLADTAGGLALDAHVGGGHGGPTIELRLDHAARPAEGASWLFAEAELLHEAGGAGYLSIAVTDDTGRSVVRAGGHYLLRSRKPRQADAPGPERDGELGCPRDEVGVPDALVRALA